MSNGTSSPTGEPRVSVVIPTYNRAPLLGRSLRDARRGLGPSAWREAGAAFAARDLGEEPFAFDTDGELPYGANYVVRAREQRRFPYDPALGRRLDGGAVGEETAVIRAVLAAGGTGRWLEPLVRASLLRDSARRQP